MWQVIAQADTIAGLSSVTPTVSELPHGTELIIRFDLPVWAPVGKVADLAGAEWWAQWLAGAGMEVIDVYGNWHWMEIRGKADPIWLIALIPLIIKAVVALGVTGFLTWAAVKITANIFVEPAKVALEREQAKIEFIETQLRAGYTPDQVTRWLEGIESPPPDVELPSWLAPAGIGMGVILLVGLAVLLMMRK